MSQRSSGRIKFFDKAKGFGFIVVQNRTEDLFFHISACPRDTIPEIDDLVEFEIGQGKKHGEAAYNIVFLS